MILPENILTPVGNLRGSLTSGGLIPGVPVIIGTASGAIANFEDGTNNPLNELIIGIEPIQEGSGDPSILNPRPLYGWNSVKVKAGGKNLYSDVFSEYIRPLDYRICPIPLEVGKTYTASVNLVGTAVTGCVIGLAKKGDKYSDFGAFITLVNSSGAAFTHTITIDSTWTSPKLIVYAANETIFNSLFENYEVQLEFGSTPSSYEPYNVNIETISLGRTIYTGSLNVSIGETNVKARPYYASYNGEPLVEPWISSLDKYTPGATPTTGAQVIDLGGTETIYQITSPPIISKDGINNIWADTGNIIQCKYIANIEKFLQWVYDNLYNP